MHKHAIKPQLTAFLLACLVYSLPANLVQSASADPQFRVGDVRAALLGSSEPGKTGPAEIQAASEPVDAGLPESRPALDQEVHAYSALLAFAQQISAARPQSAGRDEDPFSALTQFAQQIGPEQAPVRLAKAEKPAVAVKAEPAEATYVGAQVCLGCHAPLVAMFNQTLMGKIFRNPRDARERANCETCHGPGSVHVKAGGGRGVGDMISFRQDDARHTPDEYNAICLSCHEKGNRTLWRGSTHETRGLACTNCHTIMTNVTPKHQLAKLTEMDTCFQCHKNKRAEIWRSSHMPIREGKITCSNCHNPHGSYSEALLKEATVNDNCYKCHAEKRGPFLWEHPPVRENCLNCHDPHGSVNDFLLKISRPRLCQQCHANVTGHPGNPRNPKSIYAINRECQNCHSQHHGSNSPAGPRFIR